MLWKFTKRNDSQRANFNNAETMNTFQTSPVPGMIEMDPGFKMGIPQGMSPQAYMQSVQGIPGFQTIHGRDISSLPFHGFGGIGPLAFNPFLSPNLNQRQLDVINTFNTFVTPHYANSAQKVNSASGVDDYSQSPISAPPGFESELLKYQTTTGTISKEELEKIPKEILKETPSKSQPHKLSSSEPQAWNKGFDSTVRKPWHRAPKFAPVSAPATPQSSGSKIVNDLEPRVIGEAWHAKKPTFADAVSAESRKKASASTDLKSPVKPWHKTPNSTIPAPSINLQHENVKFIDDMFGRPKVIFAKPTLVHEKAKQLSAKVVEREIMKDPIPEPDDSTPMLASWGDVKGPHPKPPTGESAWDKMNDNLGIDHEMGMDPLAGKYDKLRRDSKVQSQSNKVDLAEDKKEKNTKIARLPKLGEVSNKEDTKGHMTQKTAEAVPNAQLPARQVNIQKVLSASDDWTRGRLMSLLGVTQEELETYLNNRNVLASIEGFSQDDNLTITDESPLQPTIPNNGNIDSVNNASAPDGWDDSVPASGTLESESRPMITSPSVFAQKILVNENTGSVNVTWLPLPRKKTSKLAASDALHILHKEVCADSVVYNEKFLMIFPSTMMTTRE